MPNNTKIQKPNLLNLFIWSSNPLFTKGEGVKKSHCIRLPGENRGPEYL